MSNPRRRHAGADCAGDHRRGERRFGRELDTVRDTRGAARPRPTISADTGAVNQGMAAAGGRYTATWAFSIRPVVPLYWRCTPTLCTPFFRSIPRLVDHEDRVRLAEGVHHVATQIVTDRIGVPPRPRQQMLQPVRADLATLLGDRPAIAVAVVDDWQGKGLGAELLSELTERARSEGIRGFTALVAAHNVAMVGLLRDLDADVHVTHLESGTVEYEINLARLDLGNELKFLLGAFGRKQLEAPKAIRDALAALIPDRFRPL